MLDVTPEPVRLDLATDVVGDLLDSVTSLITSSKLKLMQLSPRLALFAPVFHRSWGAGAFTITEYCTTRLSCTYEPPMIV